MRVFKSKLESLLIRSLINSKEISFLALTAEELSIRKQLKDISQNAKKLWTNQNHLLQNSSLRLRNWSVKWLTGLLQETKSWNKCKTWTNHLLWGSLGSLWDRLTKTMSYSKLSTVMPTIPFSLRCERLSPIWKSRMEKTSHSQAINSSHLKAPRKRQIKQMLGLLCKG